MTDNQAVTQINEVSTTDNQAVTLETLTEILRDREWIEFEFNTFMFYQFCDALQGRCVQLVTGNKVSQIRISEMEEMDKLTLEFSILFCKNKLRNTISNINENENQIKDYF